MDQASVHHSEEQSLSLSSDAAESGDLLPEAKNSEPEPEPGHEPGPEPEHYSGYAAVFRNMRFMCLWASQIISQFADRAVFVLFVAVLTTSEGARIGGHLVGAAQMTSLLYVAFTIPAILLSPVAGVYVDRWSNKNVMIASNFLRAICVSLIALPAVKTSPVTALSIAFLISIGSQFFAPAETASIPRLVRKPDLLCANSLFFTTMMIALGFGFAIGDPIIQATGLEQAPFAISLGFAAAALVLLGIPGHRPISVSKEPWWEELRFGLAYIAGSSMVFGAIFKITILFSTIITLNIIAVGLAEQVLDLQPHQFGYIVAAAGLGMGVGNFLVGQYCGNISPNILAYRGFTLLGFFMTTLGFLGFLHLYGEKSVWLPALNFHGAMLAIPLGITALIGASCAMVAVPTYASLQAAVPEELRGKVFGAQNTAMSFASTIPVVLVGVATDNLPGGVTTTLLILGIPTMLVALQFLLREKSE